MPSSRVARFPSFLVAMAALPAQVSVSVVAATPVSVVATSGPTSNSNALPAGPLPPGLLVLSAQAAGGATSATFQTDAVAAATGVTCSFGQGVVVGNVGDTAACAPVSLRVQFAAAAPTPVRLRVAYEDITPAGAPQPRADIDVGDDGTIDYVNGVAQGPVTLLVAGPQPLVLRVLLENALAQPGAIFSDLTVELLPDNDVVITPAVVGCAPIAPAVEPVFAERGVQVRNAAPTSAPKVFALGLETQPVLLPPAGPTPCLLLPRPDAVVYLPSFQSVSIALPAAVRPVTFWVQGVEFGAQLLTTGGFRVDAN